MAFYSNGVFTVATAYQLNQAIADMDAIGTTTNGTSPAILRGRAAASPAQLTD